VAIGSANKQSNILASPAASIKQSDNRQARISGSDVGHVLPWLEIRKGVHAYTGEDGGDARTTLTVCNSAQAYLKWIDGVTGADRQCANHPRGEPVTISSDDTVDSGVSGDYVVFIRADDSSWSGWTSTIIGLQPGIPAKTKLVVDSDTVHLAPDEDSDWGTGEILGKGTVVELISQDPKSERLYVSVGDGVSTIVRRGWLFTLGVSVQGAGALAFQPGASTSLSYQFDCDAPVPRSHFYDSGNYSAALKEIEPLAKPGCPQAEHLLGVMYANGQGVQRDLVRAYSLLLLAATA